MSGEDGNEEFYRQLQLQQQYGAERGGEGEGEGEAAPDPFTYVDPADGAAYEWDREKKAWFPKVPPGGAGTAGAGGGEGRGEVGELLPPAPGAPRRPLPPFLRSWASERSGCELRVCRRWEALVPQRFLRVS